MTRWVSSTAESAAAELSVMLVTAVDLDFSSGHVRCNDSAVPITISGNTYSGVGQYGGIDAVSEDLEIIARPIKLTLSGVDASLVSTTMTEIYQNRSATVYVGIMDKNTLQLVDTPEAVWEGRMDTMSIAVDKGSATITLSCEHRLRREPRIARYTDQDQQLAYTGDKFFELLYQIPFFRSFWGGTPTVYGGRRPSSPREDLK